jgi:hypothetical protein
MERRSGDRAILPAFDYLWPCWILAGRVSVGWLAAMTVGACAPGRGVISAPGQTLRLTVTRAARQS